MDGRIIDRSHARLRPPHRPCMRRAATMASLAVAADQGPRTPLARWLAPPSNQSHAGTHARRLLRFLLFPKAATKSLRRRSHARMHHTSLPGSRSRSDGYSNRKELFFLFSCKVRTNYKGRTYVQVFTLQTSLSYGTIRSVALAQGRVFLVYDVRTYVAACIALVTSNTTYISRCVLLHTSNLSYL